MEHQIFLVLMLPLHMLRVEMLDWQLVPYLVSHLGNISWLMLPHVIHTKGAGIFVTTIVVGGVVFSFSFTLTQRPFLRDVIFYIIAVFSTFFVMWDHKVYWWEGAGM